MSPKKSLPGGPLIPRIALLSLLILLVGFVGYFASLASSVKQRFDARRWSIPSRIFSATVLLFPGQSLSKLQVQRLLDERRYRPSPADLLPAGTYRLGPDSITAHIREFQFPGKRLPSQMVEFRFLQNKLVSIKKDAEEIPLLELEPLEIARLFGPNRETRLLINSREAPAHLLDAVVAIEDHRFYEHEGIDWYAIGRALFTDLLAGRVVQGGSTITQQLAKNYFLQPQRSLRRKLQEASLAVVIEALYDKGEVLEIYLNEIYMGQRGRESIHGMGEAARHYFGRNIEDLTLAESATLAGMIKAPNSYSPLDHPEAAIERRNLVLNRMLELGLISPAEHEKAKSEFLPRAVVPVQTDMAPLFVDLVQQQLLELYDTDTLTTQGLTIYTSLHPEMAQAARAVISEELVQLERSVPKGAADENSQSHRVVLIALHSKTGSVLALTGGPEGSQGLLNNVVNADRQPGSMIQPFVFLSALDRFTPSSWLETDASSQGAAAELQGRLSSSHQSNPRILFRDALKRSRMDATINLAHELGPEKIAETLHDLGLHPPPLPASDLALGAFPATPMELAGAYAALANDGHRPHLLSLKEVFLEDGTVQHLRQMDFGLATTPAKAYIIVNILEGSAGRDRGEESSILGLDFPCAVKSGTSPDTGDSWFVGFTTDLLVLVWVGHDDGGPLPARWAARMGTRFMNEVRPWIFPQSFVAPPGVVQRIICAQSGKLAGTRCKDKRLEVFLSELSPTETCTLHR